MGKHRQREANFGVGLRFYTRLRLVASLLFPRVEFAAFFVLATLGTSIGNEFATYYLGLIPGKMYSALIGNDVDNFWQTFTDGTLICIGKCALLSVSFFFSWLLYLSWRRNAVLGLHRRYFSNRVFYNLNCVDDTGIDNPDQRITQDVEKMCNQLAVNILPGALIGPFVVAWYTWKTWHTTGAIGVGVIYGYFVVGTIVNKILIAPLAKWSARMEKAEGDFRFKHVSLRNNAESSALYNAEPFELFECNRFFEVLLKKQIVFMSWKLPTTTWQQLFDYYGAILSYIIQFIPIFLMHTYDGIPKADLAMKISNNAFFYIMLINSFTRITDVAVVAGEMAGLLQRVAELMKAADDSMELAQQDSDDDDASNDTIVVSTDASVSSEDIICELKNVSYSLPSDPSYTLVSGLNLTIRKGQTLILTGSSGVGKSSLLRIIADLWTVNTGFVQRCMKKKSIMHLPQRPYFPVGHLSLVQQICFPDVVDPLEIADRDSTEIAKILTLLRLGDLVERCCGLTQPVDFEWQDTLTPGEQQRLSFARVLYHKPALAVLDEATSSLDVHMERLMYKQLTEYKIGYISAGHRPTIMEFHDLELHLDDSFGYELRKIEKSDP